MRKLPAICLLAPLLCPPASNRRSCPDRVEPSFLRPGRYARGPVTAPHAMVVSAHPLATQVGVDILKLGGNAIDAAVVGRFSLEVVLPDPATSAAALHRPSHRRRRGDGHSTIVSGAWAARDPRHVRRLSRQPDSKSEVGHLASGVPGSVAGLHAAWPEIRDAPLATLIAPAIRLAQACGRFRRSRDIASDRELLARFP